MRGAERAPGGVNVWLRSGRLALVSTDKVVYLFDENGERRDKFKTKPAEANSPNTYVVRAMAFSPDSTKLAIAQSDNIVFVYRCGAGWAWLWLGSDCAPS